MEQEKLYQLAYDPQQDITLWELAQIIGLNMELTRLNKPIPQKALEALDPVIRRHYRAIDVTDQFNVHIKEVVLEGTVGAKTRFEQDQLG